MKPELNKSYLRKLKSIKYELAEFEKQILIKFKIPFHLFHGNKYTPHFRINGIYDYWPATSRYFNIKNHQWGFGFEKLVNVILSENDHNFKPHVIKYPTQFGLELCLFEGIDNRDFNTKT